MLGLKLKLTKRQGLEVEKLWLTWELAILQAATASIRGAEGFEDFVGHGQRAHAALVKIRRIYNLEPPGPPAN
jgi:hypothetical protein